MHHHLLASAAALAIGGTALAQSSHRDIVETAVAAGSFATLATALGEAGLVDALQGDGPFTVFAPTDDAFARIPSHVLAELLEPGNRQTLTAILTYHVVPGRVDAASALRAASATSLNGQRLAIELDEGRLTVNDATIVQADIECSNGIIHVIDSVLMPATDDLVTTASNAGMFATLLAAAETAGLVEELGDRLPLTVLAPTDEAFAKIDEATLGALLQPANREALRQILSYHLIEGRVYADQALAAGSAETLTGSDVRIGLRDGRLVANDARIVMTDIEASDGVIHVIDQVLMPPTDVLAQVAPGRLVIGVYTDHVGRALAAQLQIDRSSALLVEDVVEGGKAQAAGVRAYDIIVAVDGHPATGDTLADAKRRAGFGGTIELKVLRRGKPQSITVEVGAATH